MWTRWAISAAILAVSVSPAALNAQTAPAVPSSATRLARLNAQSPLAIARANTVTAEGTRVIGHSFPRSGGVNVGLSDLNGPVMPMYTPKFSEVIYVYDGSATFTDSKGAKTDVRKGDIVFIPRGTAYEGTNFVNYKHAYVTFESGPEERSTATPGLQVLHPDTLANDAFKIEGPARRHYFYEATDGVSVRAWEAAERKATSFGPVTAASSEFIIVVQGTASMTNAGETFDLKVGDAVLLPKGAIFSAKNSADFRKLAVVFDREEKK